MPTNFHYNTVNAFTSKPFSANPAGVVILDGRNNPSSLSDEEMLLIAREINCPETAFLIPTDKLGHFGLRWYTPTVEVKLCGHATIASTAVLSSHELYGSVEEYTFDTLSGTLTAKRVMRADGGRAYELDFPADVPYEMEDALDDEQFSGPLKNALGEKFSSVRKIWSSSNLEIIVEVELAEGERLRDWNIDIGHIAQIKSEVVAITALLPSSETTGSPDFDTRMFGPNVGIPEDPVTGSLHCILAPLYSKKLNKPTGTELFATQGGARRGELSVVWKEEGRVLLRGQAVIMAKGEMPLP